MQRKLFRLLSVVLALLLLVQVAPLGGFTPASSASLPQVSELPTAPETPEVASRHVSEEVSLRTANTRHFRNEDGTKTVYTYAENIHFQARNGEWETIDNTLVRQGDFYVPRASGMTVAMPAVLGGNNMITVRSGQFGFSLGVPGARSEAVVPDLNFIQQSMLGYVLQDIDLNESNIDNAHLSPEDLPIELLNQQMSTARNLQSVVYYFDAFAGAHLEYIISPDGIKENIIVTQAKNEYIYQFTLELYNLVAVQQNARLIYLFCSVRGTLEAAIEAPYAVDGVGVKNYEALTISLNGNRLTLTADAAWMNAPERVFPVMLDPTYWFVADTSTMVTANVDSMFGALINPLGNNLDVGSRGFGRQTRISRGFLRFPMPQLPQDSVVVSAQVILDDNSSPSWLRMLNWVVALMSPFFSGYPQRIFDTVLAVFGQPERGYEVNIRAEQVLEAWAPGGNLLETALSPVVGLPRVTWNNQPATTGVALAIGEVFEPPETRAWIRALQGWFGGRTLYTGQYTFDITDAVQHWLEVGDNENFGIMLRAEDESLTTENLLEFATVSQSAIDLSFVTQVQWVVRAVGWAAGLIDPSSSLIAAAETINMVLEYIPRSIPLLINNLDSEPIVAITYLCTTGLQGHFSYETVNMGRAGAAHVNHFSGGLTYVHPTVALAGERMPVGLSHVYTSNHDRANGQLWGMRLGVGFRLNMIEKITPVNYYESFTFFHLMVELFDRLTQTLTPGLYDDSVVLQWIADAVSDFFDNPRQYYTLIDGTGAMHRFIQCDEDRFRFEKETNPSIYMRRAGAGPLFPQRIISDEFGNQRIFNVAYRDFTNWFDNLVDGTLNRFRNYFYLTALRDANGNETNIIYNSSGQITRVVDTIGREIRLNWDSNGYLTSIVCPLGRATQFAYNHEDFGDRRTRVSVLESITYHDEEVTTFRYAQMHDRNREAFHRTRLMAVSNADDHHFVFELKEVHTYRTTSYRVIEIAHGIAGTVEEEVIDRDPDREWSYRYGTLWQRMFYWISRAVFELVTWVYHPSWLHIDSNGRWYILFNRPDDPTYGEEEIRQNFDFEEDVGTTLLRYYGGRTQVINSLGEEAGVTYIFDRLGRAVGARDNTTGDHAFVMFTQSDGVQNLPGFMAGTAIVHNLLGQSGWQGNGIAAVAGDHSHQAWMINPGGTLRQNATGLERGESYTISLFARALAGNSRAMLFYGNESAELDLTDEWDRFTVTFEHEGRNSLPISLQAQGGAVLIEAIALEQNGGASPFNHVQNSHFGAGTAQWQLANAGQRDTIRDGQVIIHGEANSEKALWQQIPLSTEAAGKMLLFGATAQISSVRSEPYYARVAVEFFDANGRIIELETEYDCDEDGCDHADCDPTGNVRNNQVFAAFNRDVRHDEQSVAMAHVIPENAAFLNLYISYDNQASGPANAMRVSNAFAYIGAGGSTMSYLGGRVSEVRSSAGTVSYTWDGPNVESITIRRPNRDELEEDDRIDFEYDTRHNITRIVERTSDGEGENLITETLFDYKTTNTQSFNRAGNNMQARNIGGILLGSQVMTFVGDLVDADNNIWQPQGTPLASTQTVTYVHHYNDVREVRDGLGHWVRYYYDSQNRNVVTQVVTSDGSRVTYGYNEFAQAAPHAFDILTSIRAHDGALTYQNEYGFTGMGDNSLTVTGLLRNIRRNGTEYSFEYNIFGQVERVEIGGQMMVENVYFEEDDRENNQRRFALARRNYANGFTFTPVYDAHGRVVGEHWGNMQGPNFEYTFANNGMLSRVYNNETQQETQFGYDAQGRLTDIFTQSNVPAAITSSRVRLGFNNDGALDDLRLMRNGNLLSQVQFEYDNFDRPSQTTLATMGNRPLWYHHCDETGRLTGTSLALNGGGHAFTRFGFDDRPATLGGRQVNLAGNIETIAHILPNETIEFGYEFIPGSGNIQAIRQNGVEQNRYTYDGIGQLIRDAGPNRVSEYAYDMGGNLRTVTVNGEVTHRFFYDNPAWTDQLTSVEIDGMGHALGYDALGNLTNFNGRTFTWQKGRQLASISEPGLTASFTYDHTGLRTSKTVNGVTSHYIWAGSLLMARYTPQRGETLAWYYDQAGQMLGFTLNGVPYFYIRNLQGDVVAIYCADGVIVARYVYDAWGNILHAEGRLAHINPIRYRGYYWDAETQLYYLQSRYYDPALRRFISADVYMDTGQIPLGTNMYAYCLNDPVNLKDPDGRIAITTKIIIICAVIGATAGGFGGNAIANRRGATGWERVAWVGGGVVVGGGGGALVGWAAPKVAPGLIPFVANSWEQVKQVLTSTPGVGFDTFNQLKRHLGDAGAGNQWHHIVEQSQIRRSGFCPTIIHNTNNVVSVPADVHRTISGFYSSIQPHITGSATMTVRDWLTGQSFDEQLAFGLQVMEWALLGGQLR